MFVHHRRRLDRTSPAAGQTVIDLANLVGDAGTGCLSIAVDIQTGRRRESFVQKSNITLAMSLLLRRGALMSSPTTQLFSSPAPLVSQISDDTALRRLPVKSRPLWRDVVVSDERSPATLLSVFSRRKSSSATLFGRKPATVGCWEGRGCLVGFSHKI
ncbi:unnamed protein product [Linum trigynum]|uniref:Uncharacterized protein n=1 Tax=Linum trigynum TaxID=586398 RepID=A0AAV2E0C5_9ROSI